MVTHVYRIASLKPHDFNVVDLPYHLKEGNFVKSTCRNLIENLERDILFT